MPSSAPADPVLVLVSVDAEEDNWRPAKTEITVENIRELGRLDRFFEQHGIRATYFTSYQVAAQPQAAETLKSIYASGRSEIGAHLHPWNTPPLEERSYRGSSMLHNLPRQLQFAKLQNVTDKLHAEFGVQPISFRAGRFGLGSTAVEALVQCGYKIDSSVTPFISWEDEDRGPDFVGAPPSAYLVGPGTDVRLPTANGPVLEIPISVGYTRLLASNWAALHGCLHSRSSRALHLPGLAARLGLVTRATLNPEANRVNKMLALSKRLLRSRVPYLQMYFHSSSLLPGLTPYAATRDDVDRIYALMERFLEGLARLSHMRFATLSEAADVLRPLAARGTGHH